MLEATTLKKHFLYVHVCINFKTKYLKKEKKLIHLKTKKAF
jgi:hypothetical protein